LVLLLLQWAIEVHPARSKWYHNYGYNNLRDYGLADKKAAAEQLADRFSFIDINKVGIHT
jgi:hypothetical protein